MTTEITLPALGASVTEATVIRWFKEVGDSIAVDDPLMEVSTDKVDTEIPSPVAGTLVEIRVDDDETVEIGTVVATIADAPTGTPAARARPEPADNSLATLPTSPALASSTEPPVTEKGSSPARAATHDPMSTPATQSKPPAPTPSLRGQTMDLSRLRKIVAERMVDSLQSSAQLTQVVEVDVTSMARSRNAAKDEFHAREGVKLTYLPFFARTALDALQQHPALNARIDTDAGEVTYHDREHLAFAVDTDRGLYTPVIKDAGAMSITELARQIADTAERTRTGKIGPDELTGGTFTITNLGSFGALFDTPIINQPQVAILGPGTVAKRPVVIDDPARGEMIAVRYIVYLSLSYDHRLVDGADAGRFLQDVKNRLEVGHFAL